MRPKFKKYGQLELEANKMTIGEVEKQLEPFVEAIEKLGMGCTGITRSHMADEYFLTVWHNMEDDMWVRDAFRAFMAGEPLPEVSNEEE